MFNVMDDRNVKYGTVVKHADYRALAEGLTAEYIARALDQSLVATPGQLDATTAAISSKRRAPPRTGGWNRNGSVGFCNGCFGRGRSGQGVRSARIRG